MVLRFTIALLVSSTLALSPDGKCRVLVLRGGGVHGAFEVGALKAMIETLDPSEYAYDYVSGISVGALNGSILSQFEKGNEAQALGKLYDLFTGNLFSDYLDLWPNIWYNAFVKSSIINPKRAFEFIDGLIGSEPFKRKFSWLSVNIANSQVVIFDEKTPLEVRNKAIFSSASIPFVLPPVEFDGMFLVDGGSFANASVGDPIRRCQEEEGVQQKDIIVDVFMCLSHETKLDQWTIEDVQEQNAYSMQQRKRDIFQYNHDLEDVLAVSRGYQSVEFRYIVSPTTKPPNSDAIIALRATTEDVLEEIAMGYRDALKVIQDYKKKSQTQQESAK